MTAREALDQAVRESRTQFKYIPDSPGIAGDVWETPRGVERQGGNDCDGLAVWTVARALQLHPEGEYRFVRGIVGGQGHAWVELLDKEGKRYWADPTWGLTSESPDWYSQRVPLKAYPWRGEIFGPPTDYVAVED